MTGVERQAPTAPPKERMTLAVYSITRDGQRKIMKPTQPVDMVTPPATGPAVGYPDCECPRCPPPEPPDTTARTPRPALVEPDPAPPPPRGPVLYACQTGYHQACHGPYEVWVGNAPAPALVGRCGCTCHDGKPTTVIRSR